MAKRERQTVLADCMDEGRFAYSTGATFSPCCTYRYELLRVWDDAMPTVCFVMLNPSTADHRNDDPTIRRCIGFAKSWDYGGIRVVNLFAYRATNPRTLKHVRDRVGPDNDEWIEAAIRNSGLAIAAWGANPMARDRSVTLKGKCDLWCLGTTKSGAPKHPLYVPSKQQPVMYQTV
jgi:hypothetical protein